MKTVGYRQDGTDLKQYDFFVEKQGVCRVREKRTPNLSIVSICSACGQWMSRFDPDSTIFPGLTRTILDGETENEVFRLIYRDSGRYEMVMGNDRWEILAEGSTYRFLSGGKKAGCIERTARDWIAEAVDPDNLIFANFPLESDCWEPKTLQCEPVTVSGGEEAGAAAGTLPDSLPETDDANPPYFTMETDGQEAEAVRMAWLAFPVLRFAL